MNWKKIKLQLISFLQEEASKIGVNRVVIGISGGLDSAIVSALCKEAFGENIYGVMMPSHFSSDSSIFDAKVLCEKFNISYEIVEIAPMIKSYFDNVQKATPLRIGNLSARMRMSVLYDISARENAIVIGTSNKSEILLGYGTLFGDTACAINPIGEIYKSDAFKFAEFLGIPNSIINKKPSADLWEGQSDEEELGYSYQVMDDVLKKLIDEKKTKDELLKQGVDEKLLETLEYRVKSNAFKSRLPTIARINF